MAAVLLLSMLSVLTTLLGVALTLRSRGSDRVIARGIGFSVGLMILVSSFELLPEASGRMGPAPTLAVAALGMALIWCAHWLVPHVH
jgi:zinc transporter ZupT